MRVIWQFFQVILSLGKDHLPQVNKSSHYPFIRAIIEPQHDKTNKVSVRPAKTQIRLDIRPVWSVFTVRMKKAWVLSYPLSTQRRLWSHWADAQADLSLHWAHTHFVGFVMSRFIYLVSCSSVPPKITILSPSIEAEWNAIGGGLTLFSMGQVDTWDHRLAVTEYMWRSEKNLAAWKRTCISKSTSFKHFLV